MTLQQMLVAHIQLCYLAAAEANSHDEDGGGVTRTPGVLFTLADAIRHAGNHGVPEAAALYRRVTDSLPGGGFWEEFTWGRIAPKIEEGIGRMAEQYGIVVDGAEYTNGTNVNITIGGRPSAGESSH